MCSSSLVCTKNNDKSELELYSIKKALENNSLNETNGFFDDALGAVVYWNRSIIKEHEYLYDLIKKVENEKNI